MPYRRLPNTDIARLKALKQSKSMGSDLPPFKLAFSQSTFQRVQSFLPGFEKVMMEQKHAYTSQIQKNKDYLVLMKKAKLYISHFIQVMNLAVQRGDLPQNTSVYYNLKNFGNKLPALNSESDLIKWGELLMNGETQRLHQGLSPVTNPTIAVVKVRYENFLDGYKFQKTLQKNTTRTLSELSGMRNEADEIITAVWNEVEYAFKDFPEVEKRNQASEYGVVYVYRKNEIGKLPLVMDLEPTSQS